MSSNIIRPSLKKKISPGEKITPSDGVEKGTKVLYDIKEILVTIRRKDLNNFQGEYTISMRWFNLDRHLLKENLSTLELDFYTKNINEN